MPGSQLWRHEELKKYHYWPGCGDNIKNPLLQVLKPIVKHHEIQIQQIFLLLKMMTLVFPRIHF